MATLLAIGFVTGVASGLLGVGGGFVLVPLLAAVGVSLHATVGASLVFILGTSVSGALRHLRQGTGDWRLGLPLMAASSAAAVVAAFASTRLDEEILAALFAGTTAVALLLFNAPRRAAPAPGAAAGGWRVARRQAAGGEVYDYSFQPLAATAVGGAIGLVTGLLGIGGGFLLVPMLVAFLRIPLLIAIGTSLLSILAAAVAGVATHWSLLGLDPALVLPLVGAGVAGAQLGAKLVLRLPAGRLRLVYNLLLVTATLYMVARATGMAGAAAG